MNIETLKGFRSQKETLRGKKILLRLDLNVPIENGKVMDPFRIERSLETLKFLQESGAKTVIVAHLEEDAGTLEPVARYLVETFPRLSFVKDVLSSEARDKADTMRDGDMILFENIRHWQGEKKNDPEFAKELASFGEVFINDAFSVSHRAHASIVGIPPLLPSMIGFEFEKEIKELSLAFKPSHPFLLIIGGVKFDTKLPLVKKFFDIADSIFIGGAIANSFFKHQGLFVGDSVAFDSPEIDHFNEAVKSGKVILPVDLRVQSKGFINIKKPTEISVNEKIWDIGPETEKLLAETASKARFIVWNGPMGYYEEGAIEGNEATAKAVAASPGMSIVGGGDTVASIEHLGIMDKIYFVSTGGGAMLDFLANGTLPGIEAIEKSQPQKEAKSEGWLKQLFK